MECIRSVGHGCYICDVMVIRGESDVYHESNVECITDSCKLM
jgi:hypothetical protein